MPPESNPTPSAEPAVPENSLASKPVQVIQSDQLKPRSKKRPSLIIVAIIAVFGAVAIFRSYAATTPEPPIGLMIQVSSLSPTVQPATLKQWLENIRLNHKQTSSPQYVNNLVLQDIADKDGTLYTSYLDVIAPYLPGGATPIFTKVYVGTVDLEWTGTGSKYIEGIKDPAFRTTNVNLSSKAAKAFKVRYPRVAANWYITYEANLSGFWDQSIETAYATYINQLIPALNGVYANRTYLWSPAFWTPYRNQPDWALPSLKANFGHFFSTVKTPLLMDFQDFVGQSKGTSTKEDAVVWAKYLKQNWGTKMKSVQINVEQFKIDTAGAIVPADSAEIVSRQNYYQQQGQTIGPSWEIRYWHKRIYGY